MRVTTNMLHTNALRNLQANASRLADAQSRAAGGRRLTKPSDDPGQTWTALKLRDSISELNQYVRNIDAADRTMSASEAALGSAGELLQRARELSVQASNGTLSPFDRQQIAAEIGQIQEALVDLTETKVAGAYVFSGFKTDTAPYASATGTYQGDSNTMTVKTGQSASIVTNTLGDVAFGPALAALDALKTDLLAGNAPSASTQTQLDAGLDALLTARGDIGARQNRLDDARTALEDGIVTATKLLSNLEDIDMADAISDLTQREAMYEAALRVNARVLQTTMLDILG